MEARYEDKKRNTHTPHDHNVVVVVVVVVAAAAAAHDNIAAAAESFDHFLYISIALINYYPATCPPFLLSSPGAGMKMIQSRDLHPSLSLSFFFFFCKFVTKEVAAVAAAAAPSSINLQERAVH